METGDFDQTPAPSGRPSLTTLRPAQEDHSTGDTPGISASRAAAFKHHLLKTSASGPTLVDRDLPAPPVVSRSPPFKTPSQLPKAELENRGAVPDGYDTALPRQHSPVHLPEELAYSSPIRLIDRECVNPFLHPHGTHANIHHPGLLEGANFCDHGVRSAGTRSFISSTDPSSPISDVSMVSGEMHRVLSSGDISVTEVTVPIHRHKGHSIAVKVRPAFSYYPVHHPAVSGGHRGLDYSRSANKVQPFDPAANHPELTTRKGDNGIDDLEATALRRGRFEPEISDGASARTLSLGSTLDYKRTAQWLREILKYPETYTSKFTELPPKSRTKRSSSAEQRRMSETALSSILPSRRMTGLSSHSGRSEPKIDPLIFQRAVNDLEKLMNEAIALASEVVRRPDTPSCPKLHQPSISLHSCRHSVPGGQDGASQDDDGTSGCTRESPGKFEDVGLHNDSQQKRPLYQHAATYTGAPERPRLNEILQNYSNTCDNAAARGFPLQKGPSTQTAAEASLTVPGRRSSINGASHVATGPRKASDRAQKLNHKKQYGDLTKGTKDVALQGKSHQSKSAPRGSHARHASHESGEDDPPGREAVGRRPHVDHGISLRRRSHVSLRGAQGFSLAKSRKRQPTARDWSPIRKRFVATVACISTALIGVILGIYAGLVPSIQYYIIDQSHATVHGNTGCFLGLAIPTFFLWPLPLLHGRKPYIMTSLVLAMPLLFPQALAVNAQRLTHTGTWRAMLLASRALMGASLGFASMNFHSILTDLFGASLMSTNPHQEVVDHYDARRHGGGMGVWLGIWTWCWIGSLGIGFLVGACVIDKYPPTWGFYISIIMIAVVLLLNVLCPEVRRSAFRRSVAEVRTGADISRRVARGEIMMHRVKTGPKWWGQEVYHGILLTLEMLRQPGFLILAFYSAWIYAQVVLTIVLLGSLTSKFYKLRSPNVGLLVGSVALGAILAIPFQKASFFSRSRQAQLNTNKATMDRRFAWSSHLVRRTVFTILLPLAGVCYAAVSSGPPMHVGVPTIFAFCIGLLSCLAIAECNGLVMECFDTSDLSPGMTGRQRSKSGRSEKRTNYSSFPRVTAGFAAIHTMAFIFAAGATALGGLVTRTLGQQVATGVVAGILFILTIMLLLILARFTDVQIIPNSKMEEMDRLIEARRRSTIRRASMPDDRQAVVEEEKAWRPAMLGNPIGKKRRMNVFELGSKSRWQEIRKKNKLVDENAHLNQAAWNQGLEALDDKLSDIQSDVEDFFGLGSVKKRSSRRLRRSDETSDSAQDVEMGNMGNQASGSRPSLKRFVERECVMSQTVAEENEGLDDHRRDR
ncbi:major facilitator superfamily transporter [Trichoderma arundinaceum]|uniref:Major facilitator superfamily transporter n=1 Tax=Trichoderma arundinaceum TaxID=490622 RepID=A0A395NIT6_TRIAR|nr:major facilitator superfamily transporter [Trichoderma arundinaceum]